MMSEIYWIKGPWPGRLAIAARPRGGDWLPDEMQEWRADGIGLVISFLENAEAAELELSDESTKAAAAGLEFISFPITDRGTPESASTAAGFIGDALLAIESGKHVLLHCRQGIGRAGMMACGLLIATGMPWSQAIESVSVARGVRVPETAEQVRWLENLHSILALTVR